jgi:hypothetical protein
MRRAALLLAAGLLLPACGGGGDSVSAAPVAEAASKTTEAGSYRMEFTMTMEAEGQSFTMRGDGVFGHSPARGRMTVDPGKLDELSGGMGGTDRLEFVFDGLVYYMRIPEGLTPLAGAGDKWLKIDLEKAGGETGGVDLGALQQANQNPAQLMQFLRGTSDDIEELGEEQVRGIETTHYRATVDLDAAAERTTEIGELSDEMREQVRVEIERMKKQTGLETLPVDVWLDEDDLVRRIRMDFTFPLEGEEVGVEATVDLFDFGVDVDVAPPPAGQTVDITEFAKGGGGS